MVMLLPTTTTSVSVTRKRSRSGLCCCPEEDKNSTTIKTFNYATAAVEALSHKRRKPNNNASVVKDDSWEFDSLFRSLEEDSSDDEAFPEISQWNCLDDGEDDDSCCGTPVMVPTVIPPSPLGRQLRCLDLTQLIESPLSSSSSSWSIATTTDGHLREKLTSLRSLPL